MGPGEVRDTRVFDTGRSQIGEEPRRPLASISSITMSRLAKLPPLLTVAGQSLRPAGPGECLASSVGSGCFARPSEHDDRLAMEAASLFHRFEHCRVCQREGAQVHHFWPARAVVLQSFHQVLGKVFVDTGRVGQRGGGRVHVVVVRERVMNAVGAWGHRHCAPISLRPQPWAKAAQRPRCGARSPHKRGHAIADAALASSHPKPSTAKT